MRKIYKGQEPASLAAFKRQNPHARYHDLSNDEEGQAIRQQIREACTTEQFHLCAYCCQAISGTSEDTMNEHVEARDLAPKRTMDFSNLVASREFNFEVQFPIKNQAAFRSSSKTTC
ncbi:hypothetical protein, partial [Aeromonas veronii]|uniref:hypothetical protein n=1 Tax=Aeromonas veronii TaxID=654 RepID=UPI003D203511